MNAKNLSVAAFVTSLILLPAAILFSAGAVVTGFAGLNAEFSNRLVEYPVSDSAVDLIRIVTIYIFAPFCLGLFILTAINLKQNNRNTAKIALGLWALMVTWMILINWALVPHPGGYINQEGSGVQAPSSDLQIRQLDL